MRIEVLRIGQRLVRDDRVTTHVALVARAFGASSIFMNEVNPEIKDTLEKVNRSWGSSFKIEFLDDWRKLLKSKKKSAKIVHLTMYGENINEIQEKIKQEDNVLIVVGAEKVPRDVYEYADYNVAVGNQPHSEISALAITLDRIQNGKQFDAKYSNAKLEIVPTKKGKKVITKSD
jgi:tRNA (cytidine56-2'-O)-methyltransferase